MARGFALQSSLRENVIELMRVLGTVENPLSLRGLARQVNAKHPTKDIDYKMVERWVRKVEPVEPDVVSIAIMAGLAGVSFPQFALGKDVQSFEVYPGDITFDPAADRKLTPTEIQRANEVAEREREAEERQATAKQRKNGRGR